MEDECNKCGVRESEIIEQFNNKDKTADLIKQIIQVEALKTAKLCYYKDETSKHNPIYIGFSK